MLLMLVDYMCLQMKLSALLSRLGLLPADGLNRLLRWFPSAFVLKHHIRPWSLELILLLRLFLLPQALGRALDF